MVSGCLLVGGVAWRQQCLDDDAGPARDGHRHRAAPAGPGHTPDHSSPGHDERGAAASSALMFRLLGMTVGVSTLDVARRPSLANADRSTRSDRARSGRIDGIVPESAARVHHRPRHPAVAAGDSGNVHRGRRDRPRSPRFRSPSSPATSAAESGDLPVRRLTVDCSAQPSDIVAIVAALIDHCAPRHNRRGSRFDHPGRSSRR